MLKKLTLGGIKVSYRTGTTDRQIIKEVIENDVYRVAERNWDGKTVIDIGGHIGTFALLMAHLGATVYSYEPTQMNFDILLLNAMANIPYEPNIAKLAVSGKNELRKLYIREDNYGGNNFYSDEDYIYEVVSCITLEDIFRENKITHCHFLKLDCEGAELEILRSTVSLHLIDEIVVETHKGDKEQIKDILSKTHYLTEPEEEVINPILRYKRIGL